VVWALATLPMAFLGYLLAFFAETWSALVSGLVLLGLAVLSGLAAVLMNSRRSSLAARASFVVSAAWGVGAAATALLIPANVSVFVVFPAVVAIVTAVLAILAVRSVN
jgi:hypothetical protein